MTFLAFSPWLGAFQLTADGVEAGILCTEKEAASNEISDPPGSGAFRRLFTGADGYHSLSSASWSRSMLSPYP